jgi:hypothetical protein
VPPGDRASGPQVVTCASVDVAGLQAHDRRPRRSRRQHPPEVADVDCAIGVGRHRLDERGSEPEQTKRAVDRGVAFHAGDDAHRRRVAQAVTLDVPAHLGEHVVAGRGQPDGVGGLATGHKSDRGRGRKTEEVLEPGSGTLLGDRRGRGQHRVERALVPARGHDLRSARGGQGAADDEPEEARPGGRHQPRLGRPEKLIEDLAGRCRPVRKHTPEPSPQRSKVGRGSHPALRQRRPVVRRRGAGPGE